MLNHIISYQTLLHYTLASGIAALGGCVCVCEFWISPKKPNFACFGFRHFRTPLHWSCRILGCRIYYSRKNPNKEQLINESFSTVSTSCCSVVLEQNSRIEVRLQLSYSAMHNFTKSFYLVNLNLQFDVGFLLRCIIF